MQEMLRCLKFRMIDERPAWKQTMTPTDILELEITKVAQSEHEMAALQQHIKEIIESAAFKSSPRCGQFLKYIVDQSTAGRFESLKERIIGVELFGRLPDYDTGNDAIVRGTATEVRKRLLQFYGGIGAHSNYRISLPLGSYILSISRFQHAGGTLSDSGESDSEANQNISNASRGTTKQSSTTAIEARKSTITPNNRWMIFAALFLTLNIGLWFLFRNSPSADTPWPLSYLPWSAFFRSANPTVVITSDPDIAEVGRYTGAQITVSDYANHKYCVGPNRLTPEEDNFCRIVLRGDKAASVDTSIAVRASELAGSVSKNLEVHGARDIQLADLKTGANFIILGSPRSNPWSGLFSAQLDFKFIFDKDKGRELIFNSHPQPQEQGTYVPTAPGWATGQSYAIVAFIQNPDSAGQILLLAGISGEGTEAAGELMTDFRRLSQALKQCGLDHSRTPVNFEMLLRLNTMAGSSTRADVIACHILRNSAP